MAFLWATRCSPAIPTMRGRCRRSWQPWRPGMACWGVCGSPTAAWRAPRTWRGGRSGPACSQGDGHASSHAATLSDLLQLGDEEITKDRLYRGLDHLLAHKAALEAHLSHCGELFAIENEVLLYDVT